MPIPTKSYLEIQNQIDDCEEEEFVFVKLFDKEMNDISNISTHSVKNHRFWMKGEYDILTEEQAEKLKKSYIKKFSKRGMKKNL